MERLLWLSPLLLIAACAELPADGDAQVFYVEPGEGGEWDDPDAMVGKSTFTTIQDAINAAGSGDTVLVSSGTYTEDVEMAEGVDVVGAGSDETLLVGTVTFTGLTDATLSDIGMYDYTYVTTGTKYTDNGITVDGGNATIEDVEVYWFNYGVFADSAGTVTVDNARLGGNWYGAVADATTTFDLSNSLVYSNPAGGIATDNGTGGAILHNTLVGNAFSGTSAYLTGAISLGNSGTEVVANNIMTSNYYGLNCYSCGSSWSYNLVWGNTTDYINDASADSTDLSEDPSFADQSEGDYSLSATSACIDAGSSTYYVVTDSDGEERPQGDGYDIGMDEYASSAYSLLITEVMANASTESTGEFVEIYNAGGSSVDLAGFILTDGDDIDTLEAYDGGTTELAAGEYAVVVDPEYDGVYSIDSSVTVVTTGDTTIGNGLTTSDDLTLYESDGSTIAATFSYPSDPGDGVSMEMYSLESGDVAGNWKASQCADESSPGAEHCFPESGDPADLVLTEVMANADDESTGEYVEIYNPTDTDIDLAGLVFSDGSYTDTLEAYQSGSTLLGPQEHALIVDPGYAYDYYLPNGLVLVSTGDSTLGNGLSTSDSVYLYDSDGTTLIDSFTSPSDPGNAISVEKIDYTAGDDSSNWQAADTDCVRGRTPGLLNGAAGGSCGTLLITEVMANADDEDSEEFIEIYNAGSDTIDLSTLSFTDGDQVDTIASFDGGTTELEAGGYAVIVDAEYGGTLSIDSDAVVVTTEDTHLGNGLSVANEVVLYDTDGSSVIDGYYYPSNPGNAISIERVSLYEWDSSDNWADSTCAAGNSPGQDNCVATESTGTSVSDYDIVITEIMSNPDVESTGEYVELYNNGTDDVDLLYWVIYDGDAVDTILGFSDPYDTTLEAGEYALILDADYNSDYSTIPSDTLLLTTDDSAIGSGLATSDPVYLYESNASALVDTFTFPFDPGNGTSVERIDIEDGDTGDNWQESQCSGGNSPGEENC